MSRDSQDERHSRGRAFVAAYGRLVDALADDLLAASDAEVLATHTPAAARVAADTLRRRLHRDAPFPAAEAGPAEVSPGPSPHVPGSPEREP